MKFILVLGILIITTFGNRSFAVADTVLSRPSSIEAEQICTLLQRNREASSDFKNGLFFKEIIRSALFPKKYLTPENISLESDQTKTATNSNAVMFSFGAMPEAELWLQSDEARTELDFFKKHLHRIKKLKRIHQINKCIRTANAMGIDHDYITRLHRAQQVNELAQNTKASKQLTKMARREMRHSRHQWDLYTYTDIRILKDALTLHPKNSIMINAHASEGGVIKDSFGNVIPKNFFKTVSPEVRVLGILSCHSNAVIRYYGLKNRSFNVFIPSQTAFTSLPDMTPILSTQQFFKSLDQNLEGQNVIPLTPSYTQNQTPSCYLRIQGIQVAEGEVSIMVDDVWITSIRKGETFENVLENILVPCDSKSVILKDLQETQATRLEFKQESFSLMGEMNETELIKQVTSIYKRNNDDGTLNGVLARF